MNFRRLMLKLMLWSLAIAAVVGTVAVLAAPRSAVWRVVGTCLTTAFAALLMLAASLLGERPKWRDASLLAMGAVVLQFLGAVLLIWGLADALRTGSDEQIALTMALLAPVVIVAMPMLRGRYEAGFRLAGSVAAVLCIIVAAMLLIAIWRPFIRRADDELFATAGTTALFGALAVASLVRRSAATGRTWASRSAIVLSGAGVVAAALALAVTLVIIWKDLHGDSGGYAVLVSVAAFLAFANVLLAIPLPAAQRWVRIVTLVAAASTAAFIDLAIIFERSSNAELLQRLAAACGIVAGCGTLALAVLARLNRRVEIKPNIVTELRELAVTCPLCKTRQAMRLGDSACRSCGLIFHIGIEEPRCPACGYVLLMSKSDRCPECGATIATRIAAPIGVPIGAPTSSGAAPK